VNYVHKPLLGLKTALPLTSITLEKRLILIQENEDKDLKRDFEVRVLTRRPRVTEPRLHS